MTARRLGELRAADLHLSEDSGVTSYLGNLHAHYPAMPDDAAVDIVTFRITAGNN